MANSHKQKNTPRASSGSNRSSAVGRVWNKLMSRDDSFAREQRLARARAIQKCDARLMDSAYAALR